MKFSLIALAFVSTLATASSVEIFKSDKNTISWVAYPETFYKTQDGYAIMVGRRSVNGAQKETRDFMGVDFDTCKRGYGSLYVKKTVQDEWREASNVAIANPVTNADALAGFICEVGAEVEKIINKPVDTRKKISV
jgi:uncharacterized GH25 family protein